MADGWVFLGGVALALIATTVVFGSRRRRIEEAWKTSGQSPSANAQGTSRPPAQSERDRLDARLREIEDGMIATRYAESKELGDEMREIVRRTRLAEGRHSGVLTEEKYRGDYPSLAPEVRQAILRDDYESAAELALLAIHRANEASAREEAAKQSLLTAAERLQRTIDEMNAAEAFMLESQSGSDVHLASDAEAAFREAVVIAEESKAIFDRERDVYDSAKAARDAAGREYEAAVVESVDAEVRLRVFGAPDCETN